MISVITYIDTCSSSLLWRTCTHAIAAVANMKVIMEATKPDTISPFRECCQLLSHVPMKAKVIVLSYIHSRYSM